MKEYEFHLLSVRELVLHRTSVLSVLPWLLLFMLELMHFVGF